MNIKDNTDENEHKEESNSDIIQISLNLEEENYIIKIYSSKDSSTMVFKLEQENIQTFYFYEKFDLHDFKEKNKQFNSNESIKEVFATLKKIIEKCSTKLEKKSLKMDIIFIDKKQTIASFSLRKKIVSQNRLNPLLVEQIQENKSKIKALKKQAMKFDKSIQNQNDMINSLNNKIDIINDNIKNIINDISNINKNIKNTINNTDDTDLKEEEEDYDELTKETAPMINSRNNDNIKNEDNNSSLKEKNEKMDESDFYVKNIGSCKYEKIYLLLIGLNVITLIFISYLLFYFLNIKNEINLEKIREEQLRKNFSFFDFADELSEEELKALKEYFSLKNENNENTTKIQNQKNLEIKNKNEEIKKNNNIDNNKKINNSKTTKNTKDINTNIKQKTSVKNETNNNNNNNNNKKSKGKEKYLLGNEENFLRKHLIQKAKYRIKDIKLVLKYKSSIDSSNTFFNNCRGIAENLIMLRNKNRKKMGFFTKNIIDLLENIKYENYYKNETNFIGYIINSDSGEIDEIDFKGFFQIYNDFISIFKNMIRMLEKKPEKNKTKEEDLNETEKKRKYHFWEIDEIEVYQVKYIQ